MVKCKCFSNTIVIIAAIIFGFVLSNVINSPEVNFKNLLKTNSRLHQCLHDERALSFMRDGGEYFPDYKKPRTLNDKINYIFQNYFKKSPLSKHIINKYFAKKYIANIVGAKHTAKLLGVWANPEDIEWDKLPTRFVLKATHGFGGKQVMLIKDKNKINIHDTIRKFKKFCQNNQMKEMGIKKERIIAEEYLNLPSNINSVFDYKFYCSYGKPICAYCYTRDNIEVCDGDNKTCSFYSIPEWKPLPVLIDHSKPNPIISKPKHFAKMIELAEKLSKPFPLIRIDFYELDDKIIVGELTRDSHGARIIFSPVIWDFKLGEMIDVPSLSKINKLIERDKKICERYDEKE